MTRLDGAIEWSPPDLDAFLQRLAALLPVIHDVAVGPSDAIRSYRPYYLDRELRPPPGATDPAVWERAIEVYAGTPPPGRARFIHRDYHPGNVLWERGEVTGVVDWVNTSVGAPEADVGHCRVNLAERFAGDVADRFLAQYQAVSGRAEYHPYWDLVAAVGMLPDEPVTPRVDDFVARAVARL
jgi:hypothetical protein